MNLFEHLNVISALFYPTVGLVTNSFVIVGDNPLEVRAGYQQWV
jgi:hypothetical protein